MSPGRMQLPARRCARSRLSASVGCWRSRAPRRPRAGAGAGACAPPRARSRAGQPRQARQRPTIVTCERSTSKPRSASSDATIEAASSAQISQVAAAGPAVEVAVHRVGQDVVLLAPVGAVTVADDPELLEHVEGPVHGGRDRGRVALPAALHELRAGDVPVRLRQHRDQGPPLRRPAEAPVVQSLADGLPGVGVATAGGGGHAGSGHGTEYRWRDAPEPVVATCCRSVGARLQSCSGRHLVTRETREITVYASHRRHRRRGSRLGPPSSTPPTAS